MASNGDLVRLIFHRSGIAWFTPLVGIQDRSDLEYLRSAISRDYEWVRVLCDAAVPPPGLTRVRDDLGALLGRTQGKESEEIKYPWHVPRGWTSYGAIRLAMLATLPPDARAAAVMELGQMSSAVLASSRVKWTADVVAVTELVTKTPDDPSLPHRMQALWREIDFGRNYVRARVAKNTTITALLWSILVVALTGSIIFLGRTTHQPTCNDGGQCRVATETAHEEKAAEPPRDAGIEAAPVMDAAPGDTATPDATVAVDAGSVGAGDQKAPPAKPKAEANTLPTPDQSPPRIWLVALLGLLGGSISALRSTDLVGERRSLEVEAVRLRLRPVVGATMAVVVYLIGRSELVFQMATATPTDHRAPIQFQVPVLAWGYYALGFVAGFSERWFLKIVDLVEGRIDPPPAAHVSSTPVAAKPAQAQAPAKAENRPAG